MRNPLIEFTLNRASDVANLGRRVKILGSLTELPARQRAALSKAVSQVCRHMLEHGTSSQVRFGIVEKDGQQYLQVDVGSEAESDKSRQAGSRPAAKLDEATIRGLQRMGEFVDEFQLQGSPESGLQAVLRQLLPATFHLPSPSERELWLRMIQQKSLEDAIAVARRRGQAVESSADVMARQRALEQQLSESSDDAESRTLLSLIASVTDNFVVMMNGDGTITWVNDAFVRMTGYSAEQVKGSDFVELLRGPLTDEATVRDLRQALIEGHSFKPELRLHRQDGSDFWTLFSLAPVRGRRGQVAKWIAIGTDVTQQHRSAEALAAAREAAESANRAKSDFLANMSHEIRTPLNAIIGMTELALDTPLTREQRDYLTATKLNAEALLDLLNDILDLSKIEAGKLVIDNVEFNLADLLRDTVKALAVRAHVKGLELATHMPLDIPQWVNGDPVRLRQILVNLIGNAIKFTEEGEVIVEVEKQWVGDGNVSLKFTVRDTGCGIPPDRLDRIFEAFEQADTSTTRQFGGTGLGLTITAELLRMMGGRIWIESEPGIGSAFHFSLRFGLIDPPNVEERPELQHLEGMKVLVVDDNASNRRILAELLKRWKLRPVTCASGDEALAILAEAKSAGEPFDITLLDAMMPGMDGFELASRIRENGHAVRGPVMMLSSADRPTSRARCEKSGIDVFLTKPVSQSTLQDAMLTSIGQRPVLRPSEATTSESEPAATPLRVLVADHEANRTLATRMLEKRGHECTPAVNGMEVLRLLEDAGWFDPAAAEPPPFDVVLMDAQMPLLDGYSATRQIRERELHTGRHLPIIAVTAHAMKGDREKCLAAGMDDYLAKPLRADELTAMVERVACVDAPAAANSNRDRSAASTGAGTGKPGMSARDDQSSARVAEAGHVDCLPIPDPAPALPSSVADSSEQRPVPDLPPIDFSGALDRMGGDREMLCEQMEYFLNDAPKLLEEIASGVEDSDLEPLQNAAHRLKSLLRSYDCDTAADLAFSLESIATFAELSHADTLLAELRPHVEHLLHEIRRFIEHGKT